MTVTNVDKDFERLTLTATAEFAAPPSINSIPNAGNVARR